MGTLRSPRRRWISCSIAVCHLLLCLVSLFLLHSFWCYTKDECSDRLLCPRRQITILTNQTQRIEKGVSLCSARSTRRGPHQRVIGVSAYRSVSDSRRLFRQVWRFLLEYLAEAQEKYPEWTVRVYHYALNASGEELLRIEQKYANVDFCDSTNIPAFGNVVHWLPGKMQRFLPLVDPLVDTYMSRDIDSPIFERETTIVRQWLKSEKTIHIIRDHPQHIIPILGGLWGIKLDQERAWRENVAKYLLSPDVVRCYSDVRDQNFLEDVLWPHANTHKLRTMEHDSFHCQKYRNAIPFPTRKESPTHFVGCRRPNCTQDRHEECPMACRPADHPDWIWC